MLYFFGVQLLKEKNLTHEKPSSQNRREFFRLKFSAPVRFKSRPKTLQESGISKNISQSGILFETPENPPQLSSLLWMDLDLRTLKICQEIENRALILNNGVVGKVVRVEEGQRNYDIGVCFLTQEEKDSSEVQELLSEISNYK